MNQGIPLCRPAPRAAPRGDRGQDSARAGGNQDAGNGQEWFTRDNMTALRFCLLIMGCLLFAGCGPGSTPEGPTVATLAGSGKTGPLGGGYADGPALEAQFHDPMGLVFDADGNLYVSGWVNHRVRIVTTE